MKEDDFTKLEMKEIATNWGLRDITHIICYGDVSAYFNISQHHNSISVFRFSQTAPNTY